MNQSTSYSYTFGKDGTMERPGDDARRTGTSGVGRENGEPSKGADEPQFNCAICLDQPVDPVVTMCGHMFCWECIREWMKRSQTCPICHSVISVDKMVPVYGGAETRKRHAFLNRDQSEFPSASAPPRDSSANASANAEQEHGELPEHRPEGRREEPEEGGFFNNFFGGGNGVQIGFGPFGLFSMGFGGLGFGIGGQRVVHCVHLCSPSAMLF